MRISDWSSDVCSSDLLKRVRKGWHSSDLLLSEVPAETVVVRSSMDDKPADECWSEKQPWRRQERSLMGNPSRLHRGRPDGTPRASVLTRHELGQPRRMAHRPYPPALLEIGRASCRERVCQS